MSSARDRVVLLLLVPGVLLAACDGVEETVGDVVDEAEQTVQLVEFCAAGVQVAQALEAEDLDAAIDAAETMVAEAPDDIAAEAETVLAGAQAARDGDPEAVRSEEFQAAANEVQAYTRGNCDPTS